MKPLTMVLLVSLMLFSCATSHQVVSLSKDRYKIQLTGKTSPGKPTQDLDSLFKKKADEICQNYKIVSVDSAITPDKRYATKTWVIECVNEKSAGEPQKVLLPPEKEEKTVTLRPNEERTILPQPKEERTVLPQSKKDKPALVRPEPDWRYWNGLAITVKSHDVVQKCRRYGEEPAEGSKLVYAWIAIRNTSNDTVKLPSFVVELEGVKGSSKSFGGKVCRYDEDALGNACWKWHGGLYRGGMCEGWELFEVPERMQVEGRDLKYQCIYSRRAFTKSESGG
jgi:hypothetical protein